MKYTLEFTMVSGNTITAYYDSKEKAEAALEHMVGFKGEWCRMVNPTRIVRLSNVEDITLESE